MVKMASTVLRVVVVIIACAVVHGTEVWHRADYPNPQLYVSHEDECGRGHKSFICDPNQIITPGEANQLDNLINEVSNQTRCPCSTYTCRTKKSGYMIGVALMKKIVDDELMSSDADEQQKIDNSLHKASLFAYTLEQNWGLGDCDEDIIIVYSKDDNALYTMAGAAAARKLGSSDIGSVAMRHRYLFSNAVFDGLKNIIRDYRAILLK